MQGWIKLHSHILQHRLFQENVPYSRMEAWLDLVLQSAERDGKAVITSESQLMDRWRWSKSKVRRFLDQLEQDGFIEREIGKRQTIIRVLENEHFFFGDGKETRKPEPRKPKKQKSMIDRLAAAQDWIEAGGDPYAYIEPD